MNEAISAVFMAVAEELAQQAKDSMPEMREGEVIRREWYKNGVYSRETVYQNAVFVSEYNFRQRKSRRVEIKK